MKLPNNYGSITKLSGNRRRPFMVRKSLDGKQLVIGYFETKEKALQALADYNRQPSELPKTSITLTTLYKQWLPHHAPSLSKSGVASYENSYRHIQSIAAIPIQNLTYDDFQGVLDAMQLSYASKKKVRSLINQLCKFAIKKDLMQRNFGDLVTIGKNSKIRPHKPFTRQQINKLWQLNTTESDGALILLYTGMRCGELLNLRRRDINLKSKYLTVTKSKTKAGEGRIIPIHKRIQPIIESRCSQYQDRLFPISYTNFAKHFSRITNGKHTTHDCRHTVATMLDSADANPNAVRAILGHKNGDITDKVYTHKGLRDLRRAINLLK